MNVVLDEEEKELEKPAAGTITARNSSRSISPSPLASPRAKMESTSMGLSFRKHERISSLLIIPSPLMSIFLNELAASSLPLNCLLILTRRRDRPAGVHHSDVPLGLCCRVQDQQAVQGQGGRCKLIQEDRHQRGRNDQQG